MIRPDATSRFSKSDRFQGPLAAFSFVLAEPSEDKEVARQPSRSSTGREMLFQSPIMRKQFELAKRYARSTATVLITGESGTGKELFSRLIHQQSRRHDQPLVAVNCAAIAESLVESEWFGHEKGAFTGADRSHVGLFQRAHRGTLLLDEVSEIPQHLQAKLLRVLEEMEVQPVGSQNTRPIDVRIVATTNRPLAQEVAAGRFRTDLYHRLNVLELNVPPLRERVPDIPLLVIKFLQIFQNECDHQRLRVTDRAMQRLCRYDWPGNVRELRNVIHRACVIAETQELTEELLPIEMSPAGSNVDGASLAPGATTLAEIERYHILTTLQKFNGDKKQAAAELGVTAKTIANKLKLYRDSGCSVAASFR